MAESTITAVALDLGTTSVKAGLLGADQKLVEVHSMPSPEMTVDDGKYESDGMAYLEIAEQLLQKCLSGLTNTPPFGLCSQRSSFLIWDRESGVPVTPLISWQDNRGAKSCASLEKYGEQIQKLTGLHLISYYFAPKAHGLLLEHAELHRGLKQGALLIGTLDSFLIWHWSSGRFYQTDMSMAARTLLIDIQSLEWSPKLCQIFNIPANILPEIRPSLGLQQRLDNGLILQVNLADQSAALIASVQERKRDVLVNLGTGGFVVTWQPDRSHEIPSGYLKKLVYQDDSGKPHFAAEGTLNSIASALEGYPYEECTEYNLETRDIFCIAEPSGVGAPFFHDELGLCFSQSPTGLNEHQLAGLMLEGIIFRVVRILEDFDQYYQIEDVYLSGGLSNLSFIQQGIAQCSPVDVYNLLQKDSTLLGTALLAAEFSGEILSESAKIDKTENFQGLHDKYQYWKRWFDDLLSNQACCYPIKTTS